jgi:sugar (pentulose or hexulose) kinase
MPLVAGLDFGGGAVKACVAEVATGEVVAMARGTTPAILAPGRAEFEPRAWWTVAAAAMRDAVAQAERPAGDYAAVTVTSLRQGYVLLDATAELGYGVLNSDRRGAGHLERIRDIVGRDALYDTTGHWSAPQLTLPKLLEEQIADPDRWARTECLLFVHDWALWRLSGRRMSEPTMASAGQLLDIRRRDWAGDLVRSVGLDPAILPPLLDAGSVVGELRDDTLGLPPGIPVVVGGGDTQVAAAGGGGLEEGTISVVAGTTTPLQASSGEVVADPLRHPWISAHLVPERWAVETNAGYTGMRLDWLARITGISVKALVEEAVGSSAGAAGISAVVTSRTWSERTWSDRAPTALVGFETEHRRADVAQAFIEAHAYAIRGNLEDLQRAMGVSAGRICLMGEAARSARFGQLVADVTGREISVVDSAYPPARGFAWLATCALGEPMRPPIFEGRSIEPREPDAYEAGFRRYVDAGDAIASSLAGWVA